MKVFRCDFCSAEVEDYHKARWLWLEWFTGEQSSGYFQRPENRKWLFCSPACVSHFAELESVQE